MPTSPFTTTYCVRNSTRYSLCGKCRAQWETPFFSRPDGQHPALTLLSCSPLFLLVRSQQSSPERRICHFQCRCTASSGWHRKSFSTVASDEGFSAWPAPHDRSRDRCSASCTLVSYYRKQSKILILMVGSGGIKWIIYDVFDGMGERAPLVDARDGGNSSRLGNPIHLHAFISECCRLSGPSSARKALKGDMSAERLQRP